MTKLELIGRMAVAAGISREQAKLALEAFTDGVTESLSAGRDVRLTGFGSFVMAERKAGLARNPQTGEDIQIPEAKVVKFTVTKDLKEALN